MTTTNAAPDSATETPKKKIKASQVVMIAAAAIGIGAALNGVVTKIFESSLHTENPVSRPVFQDIPTALYWAFYLVVPTMLIYGGVMFAYRMRNWERGRPDNRAPPSK